MGVCACVLHGRVCVCVPVCLHVWGVPVCLHGHAPLFYQKYTLTHSDAATCGATTSQHIMHPHTMHHMPLTSHHAPTHHAPYATYRILVTDWLHYNSPYPQAIMEVAYVQYVASTRAVHRQYMGSTWAVHGQYMGSTWAVHGQYMGSS